jgi:hypothetical protein
MKPFDTAETYRNLGWSGTLALPAARKSPPPDGFTGHEGRWPTNDDLAHWREKGLANIALRLPPIIIGLDIDQYGEKTGAETLAVMEKELEPLPATWRSTSRGPDNPSGIRLFRVPHAIGNWPTQAGKDIEIIRYAHRYAVVWPSEHPDGRTYQWVRPDGTLASDEIPQLGDFPELPAAWIEALTGTSGNGAGGHATSSRASKREEDTRAKEWLRALPGGEPCAFVGRLAADALAAARREDGSAYDNTRDAVFALLRAGETGHPGLRRALAATQDAYVQTVAATRGGESVAKGEFRRFTLGAATKILAAPGERAGRGCDCAPGPTHTGPATEPSTPTTWRTLAEVPNDPPGPLLLDMFEPDGPNLIYAAGGVGKGSTCAWVITECAKIGIKVLIYDAEGHPGEWRRRVEGLGGNPADTVIVEPHELPQNLMGKPLHEVVPYLGAIAHEAGCGLIIVDSILAAANLSEEGLKSNAAAPYLYVRALGTVGKPSISIAHPPKNSASGEPYGSVSWVNAMRLTWFGTHAEGDGHNVRWTPRKRNERGRIATVRLEFHYNDLGQLSHVERKDDEFVVRDWITSQLMELGEATVPDLAEEMIADDDDGNRAVVLERAKDTISRTLRRMRKAGQVHKMKGSRPARWALGDGR